MVSFSYQHCAVVYLKMPYRPVRDYRPPGGYLLKTSLSLLPQKYNYHVSNWLYLVKKLLTNFSSLMNKGFVHKQLYNGFGNENNFYETTQLVRKTSKLGNVSYVMCIQTPYLWYTLLLRLKNI